METRIQIFKNEMFGEIRTMTNERGETFFVGKDVAKALGYSDSQKAIRTHVDDEDKGGAILSTPGGKQKVIFINESGLYALILSSKLEQAKAFKRWVTSEVLNVSYDAGAKDITRVFFTTTDSAEDLLYLDDDIFKIAESEANTERKTNTNNTNLTNNSCNSSDSCSEKEKACSAAAKSSFASLHSSLEYNGLPYRDIIAKYWELFNGGKEPVEGDRNALTFELAVTICSICGYSLERLLSMQGDCCLRALDGEVQPVVQDALLRSAATAKQRNIRRNSEPSSEALQRYSCYS